jgi:flavin reductase ActVB
MNASMTAPPEIAEDFREAMRRLASSVVMVTTWLDERPWGLTVSACCSISMSPPSLMVSLGQHTTSAASILEQERFGVSILGEEQQHVARFGSRTGEPKFVAEYCDPAAGCASPMVAGTIAHVDCALVKQVAVADHVLLIGEVTHVVIRPGQERPLVFYARDFHRLHDEQPQGQMEGFLYPPW